MKALWALIFGVVEEATPTRKRLTTSRIRMQESAEATFRRKLAEAQQGGNDLERALQHMREAREARVSP